MLIEDFGLNAPKGRARDARALKHLLHQVRQSRIVRREQFGRRAEHRRWHGRIRVEHGAGAGEEHDLAPTRSKSFRASRISIGHAAQLTGLTIRAIRFYEQRGLIEGQRDARDVRTYDAMDFDRLTQIAELRTIGVRLDDIAALITADALPGSADPEGRLGGLLRAHRRALMPRLSALHKLAARQRLDLGPAPDRAAQGEPITGAGGRTRPA